jgi:MoaA/NifB/PqqE/SkfB family radical SAM enzyme
MIYNSVNDVKKMMIDITTNCQALCPGCQRTRGGTKEHPVNPTLTTGQNDWPLGGNMSFDIFKKALPVELISGDMEHVNFTGNFGEPTFHPQFKEFVQYLYDNKGPYLVIDVSTNGGLHTPEWWVDFAKMHKKFANEYKKQNWKRNLITFAIDGIDDETQQKYRRGVNYDKAMTNARAFIDAGGNAEWQFIAFKHNEHQIEEAKKLAKEYGFKELSTSRTRSVFNAIDDISHRKGKREIEANETKKHKKEKLIQIDKLPNNQSNEDMINLVKEAIHVNKNKTFEENADNYIDTTEIICDWGDIEQKIMVEHDGTVFQCCFFVGSMKYGHSPPDNTWEDYYEKKYLPNFNSLHSHTLEEIICKSDLWKKDLHESWKNTTKATVNPRLWMCSTHCGKHRRDVEQYTIGAKH